VSYTERLVANVNFLEGVVADRCANVGGATEPIVDRAGAEELKLGCWKMAEVLFSACAPLALAPPVAAALGRDVGDSAISFRAWATVAVLNAPENREMLASKPRGGRKGGDGSGDDGSEEVDDDGPWPEEWDPCRCSPSM
jgi:hypothetical protein